MLSALNLIREQLAAAPGVGNFNLPNAGVSGSKPYRSCNAAFGTSGRRACFYVASTSTQLEAAAGYHDPSGNSGNGQIIRVAGLVMDGSAGAGTLVNFTSAPEIIVDYHAHVLTSAGIDARNISEHFEDFLAGTNGTKFANLTANSGSTWAATSPSGGAHGIATIGTGTTTNGQSSILFGSSNIVGDPFITLTRGIVVAEWSVKLLNLSSAADLYDFRVGLIGGTAPAAGDPTNGVWFQCGSATDTALGNTGHWSIACTKASAKTGPTDTGVLVSSTPNFQRLRVEVRDDGSAADFLIDGANVGTLSSNLPAASTGLTIACGIGKAGGSTGTTLRTAHIDYAYLGIIPNAPRQ